MKCDYKSILFNLLLLYLPFVSAGENQRSFIQLTDNNLSKAILKIFIPEDPFNRITRKSTYALTGGKTQIIELEILSLRNIRISYKGSNEYFMIKPNPDTLKLSFNQTRNGWDIVYDPFQLNTKALAIEDYVEESILKLSRVKKNNSFLYAKKYADSLRTLHSKENQPEIRDYVQLSASYLEAFFNRKTNVDFIRSQLDRTSKNIFNPAWGNLFLLIFDKWVKNDILTKNETKWLMYLKSENAADSIIRHIKTKTGTLDDTLALWILINGIRDLNETEKVKKSDLFNLLESLERKAPQNEAKKLIQFLRKRIKNTERGCSLPLISCKDDITGKILDFNKLTGKPGYMLYLPDEGKTTLDILAFLDVFSAKYGKEMSFIAFMDIETEPLIRKYIEKKNYPFFISPNNPCAGFIIDFFETTDRSCFLLFDKAGKIWQSPAESPLTNVEAAFLGLIKK